MQFRRLGNSGLHVSVIGLGTNQFGGKVDEASVKNLIDAAMDAGINLIDTADMYQNGRSEETIGKAIKGRRDNVLIATKFFYARGEVGPNEKGGSRYHLLHAVEASLRRLDSDYIDLYQMHSWDDSTPIEETLRALDDLVTQGKVRYIGASNFAAWQLTQAKALSEMKAWNEFVSIQPHYHMFERGIEEELIPACNYFGWGILPYFPLAGGFLTGKYKAGEGAPAGSRGEHSAYVQKYMTGPNFSLLDTLTAFATERGHTLNELAHAWLLGQPAVSSVISGATQVEHVQANAVSSQWEMSAEEYEQVNKVLDGIEQ